MTKHVKNSKIWNVVLWVGQVLLAGMFLMAGYTKGFTPMEELAKFMPLAAETPWLTRFIGFSELAGGLGLILPAALRIMPKLTVYAAAALAFVMGLAILYHVVRAEYSATVMCVVLGVVAAFVAWGRTYKAPITPKETVELGIGD